LTIEAEMSGKRCGKLELKHQMHGHPFQILWTEDQYELDACVLWVIKGESQCEIQSVNCMAFTNGLYNSNISEDAKHDLENVKIVNFLDPPHPLEENIVNKYGAKTGLIKGKLIGIDIIRSFRPKSSELISFVSKSYAKWFLLQTEWMVNPFSPPSDSRALYYLKVNEIIVPIGFHMAGIGLQKLKQGKQRESFGTSINIIIIVLKRKKKW
jgi:hypothetical protein